MRPDTEEWLKKAEADFLSMTREMNAARDFNYDLVCFLAQQSVEKYLKALLCETSVRFPKIHDLNKLAALLPEHFKYPESFAEPMSRLDRYSVEFRYPGASATHDLAAEASKPLGLFEIGVEKR
jgi:HEPN domain-containing protein